MRILLITNGYPPHRWAGTETYTAGIAEELAARGHQIHVLCAGDWEKGEHYWNGYQDEERNGVFIRRLNLNWLKSPDPSRYLYDNPVVENYLTNYLEEIRPAVVHVTSCETLSASVLQVVKDANLPLVLSLTDFWFLCPRITLLRSDGENCDGITTAWDCLQCMLANSKAFQWPRKILSEENTSRVLMEISKYPVFTRQRGLRGMALNMENRKFFLREAIGWADHRITASRFVHDVFIKNGVLDPISIQPYGHDLSWLDGYSGKTLSDRLRIGFIGQIIPSKGVHLLLQAASSLQEQYGENFRLSIFGSLSKDPDYSEQLLRLANESDNIQFCGTYAHEDSARVFANIDLLVIPSIWYDFPLIIYEAFATKTPVIATNLGGMAETVEHKTNGLLFARGDSDDLAKQIRRLIEEPGLLDQLRARIPPVKTISEEVNELEGIYRELAAAKLSVPS